MPHGRRRILYLATGVSGHMMVPRQLNGRKALQSFLPKGRGLRRRLAGAEPNGPCTTKIASASRQTKVKFILEPDRKRPNGGSYKLQRGGNPGRMPDQLSHRRRANHLALTFTSRRCYSRNGLCQAITGFICLDCVHDLPYTVRPRGQQSWEWRLSG
jgi:hypothetical protein